MLSEDRYAYILKCNIKTAKSLQKTIMRSLPLGPSSCLGYIFILLHLLKRVK